MRLLLSALILSNLAFATASEDSFKQLYGSSIYQLDNNILSNGNYSNRDIDYTNFSLGGDYYFKDETNKYRPFILGSIGYSKYEKGAIEYDSYFGNLGGGVKIEYSPIFSNSIGLKQAMMYTDDTEIKTYKSTVFNQFSYHPKYGDVKPYANLTLSYNYIKYDNDIEKTKGADARLKLGIIKDNFFTLKNIPVTAEAYTQVLLLDRELSKINNFDALYTLGGAFMWKVGKLFDKSNYLSHIELKLHGQVSKSNKDFEGYNVGVGVKLFGF